MYVHGTSALKYVSIFVLHKKEQNYPELCLILMYMHLNVILVDSFFKYKIQLNNLWS